MASRNPPAAGASGGRAPLPAVYRPPRYINWEAGELSILLNNLRDPLCTHVRMLIESFCVFETGEFLGSYAQLIELSTPPQPERGPRRSGPSMRVIRRAVDDLIREGVLRRGTKNLEHGQLRLFVIKRSEKTGTPTRIEGRE